MYLSLVNDMTHIRLFSYFMNDALIGELMPINDVETVNPLRDTYSKNA